MSTSQSINGVPDVQVTTRRAFLRTAATALAALALPAAALAADPARLRQLTAADLQHVLRSYGKRLELRHLPNVSRPLVARLPGCTVAMLPDLGNVEALRWVVGKHAVWEAGG